jgi:SAM-dependent methyltransferase
MAAYQNGESRMTWSLENSRNNEAAKIRWELVPYMNGRILDLGCGPYKAFPHFTGVDNGHHWGMAGADVKVDTAEDLSLFAGRSCDGVFSSHLLEHIPFEKVPATLTEWMRVLKPGGHLMLYLPADDAYPHIGEFGCNADHKWEPNYDNVIEAMEKVPCGWDCVDYQHRTEGDEYSIFMVFKKL